MFISAYVFFYDFNELETHHEIHVGVGMMIFC